MDQDLYTEFINIDGRPALAVRGEIDMATAPQFLCACNRLTPAADQLVLDFTDVTFIDSSGLKVLVAQSKRSGVTGIRVLHARQAIMRTFRTTGLAHFAADPPLASATG